MFWGGDADGQIYTRDMCMRFRELDFNIFISLFALFITHSGFSYPTQLAHSWLIAVLFWCRLYWFDT